MKNLVDVSHTWTVTSLTEAIKSHLEGSFPAVMVQGEVSNCKLQQSGHWYLTLKDENAQISAVLFRGEAASLQFQPQNGDKVIVEGALNVYPQGGRYQLIIRKMQKQGLGELLLRLEELKKKIHQRSWFKKEHKKPLPFIPHTIGVVTSPTGAAIQDMLNVLTRRSGGFRLILNPVKVQGEGAAEEIARAIRFFNERMPVDVIILGRGGGSFEDLWCFNEECVAEAVFYSKIPIICAVGHESDHCIAEYVADVRAPTPSAAAELVMAERTALQKQLSHFERQSHQALLHHIHKGKKDLEGVLRHPLFKTPYHLLGPRMQKLDETRASSDRNIQQKLRHLQLKMAGYRRTLDARDPRQHLRHLHQSLQEWNKSFARAFSSRLVLCRQRLTGIQQTLQAIDPRHLLNKGFSILFAEKDGSVITKAESVSVGDSVQIRLAKGSLKAIIDTVKP